MLTKESFFDLLKARFHSLKEKGGVLLRSREKAWDQFIQLGLPDKSFESFHYIPFGTFYQTLFKGAVANFKNLDSHIYPECQESCIVLVDGQFSREFSRLTALPNSMAVLSIEEAMRTYGGFLQNRWQRHLKEEKDPFAALNGALHGIGVFIYAPPQTICSVPIQILHFATEALSFPKIHFFAGESSQIDLVLSSASDLVDPHYINSTLDFVLEEHGRIRLSHAFSPLSRAWHFDSLRATLKRGAVFESISLIEGAQTVRSDIRAELIGEEAEAHLLGIWSLDGASQAHVHAVVDHQAPRTRSKQHFRGILSGNSQSSFEGNIIVRKEAQKTEAYQLNRNLLLSEKALAQSKPRLEIFADDVKASHGATTSSIDPAQMFYLNTRGIPIQEARRLLVDGFRQEITNHLFISSLRKKSCPSA